MKVLKLLCFINYIPYLLKLLEVKKHPFKAIYWNVIKIFELINLSLKFSFDCQNHNNKLSFVKFFMVLNKYVGFP
jgi:hypothetical protein